MHSYVYIDNRFHYFAKNLASYIVLKFNDIIHIAKGGYILQEQIYVQEETCITMYGYVAFQHSLSTNKLYCMV